MDLIDRHNAIDAMFAEMPGLTFYGVLRVLRNLPTIDTVCVVRCKDCVFWDTFPSSSVAPAYHKCKCLQIHTVANDYCSRGVNINEKI